MQATVSWDGKNSDANSLKHQMYHASMDRFQISYERWQYYG